MLLYIWAFALFAALFLYFRQAFSRFKKYGVKHQTPIPPFGNMLKLMLMREHFTTYHENQYKPYPNERFVGGYEFFSPVLTIRDLDLIKKITVKDFDHFVDHKFFIDGDVEPLFGRGLFSLKGQQWKDMRSTLSPAFTSSKIRLMVLFMEEVGIEMISSIKRQITMSEKEYLDVDSRDLMMRYTNDVIASCAFGLKVNSHTDGDNQFYEMGKAATTFTFLQFVKFLGYGAFPNLMKMLNVKLFSERNTKFFRDLVTNTMNDRIKHNIQRNDMIHLLMEAKKGHLKHDNNIDKDADAGFATVEESDWGKTTKHQVWTDDDLIAQAVLFFVAGFEASSTSMAFLLHELAVNPDIQERLYEEIRENHERRNGKFDYNSIQYMKYLDMVISEVLRLWPSSPALDRICVKDYNIGKPNDTASEDYIIRTGEAINISVWAIHRDPNYFPDPDKFDPERFSDENKYKIVPFSYMPFGLGPRNCIGSRFTLCKLKMMVYQLLLHMEVSPAEKTCIPIELSTADFNLRIKGGHWIRLRSRQS